MSRSRQRNKKNQDEVSEEWWRKLEYCSLHPEAPPATVTKGQVTQRDGYYGSSWVTSGAGNISFERAPAPEEQQPMSSTGNGVSASLSLSLGLPASSSGRMRPRTCVPASTTALLASLDRKNMHPVSRDEKLEAATNTLLEFKWKNNGREAPPTPVPLRSSLTVRESRNFNEHIPGRLSPWKPTPRALREADFVQTKIKGRLDIAAPIDFLNVKPKLPQALTVGALQLGRLSKSKGLYGPTRVPYRPVERKLFQSPYNKPCWGGQFARPPKLDLANF